MNSDRERTVQDVLDTFNEEQQKVVHFMIGKAVEEALANKKNHQERIFWITDSEWTLEPVTEHLKNGWRVKTITTPVRDSICVRSIVVLEKD